MIFDWGSINWGSVADWVSGIGSSAAVVTALYLARATKRIHLRVYIGHRLVVSTGQKGPAPEYLKIGVVNIGSRVARITNIEYRVGIRRKQFGVQSIDQNPLSSAFPIDLTDGQEAHWLIPLKESNWVENFARDFLMPNWRVRLWSARLHIHTSVGRVFKTQLEESIKERLAEACKRQTKTAIGNRQ